MLYKVRRVLVAMVLLLGVVSAIAQPKFNSPFSRFGVGDLVNPNLPSLNGMGDIGAAYQDLYNYNATNPASLASLGVTAFEIGLNAKNSTWTSDSQEEKVWSGNISHLALAFPLRNDFTKVMEGRKSEWNMGMAFSLLPKSQVGYNVEIQKRVEGSDEPIDFLSIGTGGIYTLNWGYGISYKNLSMGANLGFLFGNISNLSTGELLISNTFNYESSNQFSTNGTQLTLGSQYNIILRDKKAEKEEEKSKKWITVGAYTTFNSKVNITQNNLIYRERLAGGVQSRDTFSFVEDVTTKGVYPGEFGIGAHYVLKDKLRVGVNYTSSNWTKFENTATGNQTFSDASTFSIGGAYTPNQKNYKSYWERVTYKAGFVRRNDYREFLNSSLTNTGVTLGLGLPVILPNRGVSFVNFALELGKFGSEETLQESYVKMSLGFTLNDNSWFFKRKFN